MKYDASSLPSSLRVHSPGDCKNMREKGEEKEERGREGVREGGKGREGGRENV